MSRLHGFNPFESDWNCLHPQIILNPKFPELVSQYGNYTFKGEFIRMLFSPWLVHSFPRGNFHPDKVHVEFKDLLDCFVTDMSTGELFPMYLVVPCGKCIVCSNAKVSNFARRCQYETQVYDCDPVHITITYDEAHIPSDRSVNLRHIQLWKKRFRKALDDLMYGRAIRMCVASEYGSKATRRPHYHIIVWNLKEHDIFDYRLLKDIAWQCWYDENDPLMEPMCWYERFQLMPINANYIPKGQSKSLAELGKTSFEAFGYVAKYFYKSDESTVPPGCKPLFHTMTKTKNIGGIGAPFIDKHAPYMRSHLKKEYLYREQFSGSVQTLRYDRYVLNRVFPSKYSSVPGKVREALRFLFRYGALFPHQRDRIGSIYAFFGSLYPVIPIANPDPSYCFRGRQRCVLFRYAGNIENRVSFYVSYLEKMMTVIDTGKVLYLHQLRHELLSRIFPPGRPKQNVWSLSLKLTGYKVRRKYQFTTL